MYAHRSKGDTRDTESQCQFKDRGGDSAMALYTQQKF